MPRIPLCWAGSASAVQHTARIGAGRLCRLEWHMALVRDPRWQDRLVCLQVQT
jgi:hypothetical protein